MVSVSSLVFIIEYIRLVVFQLFRWDGSHCDLYNFILKKERGKGMSATFLGIC